MRSFVEKIIIDQRLKKDLKRLIEKSKADLAAVYLNRILEYYSSFK